MVNLVRDWAGAVNMVVLFGLVVIRGQQKLAVEHTKILRHINRRTETVLTAILEVCGKFKPDGDAGGSDCGDDEPTRRAST
jgi:hypothetical protein